MIPHPFGIQVQTLDAIPSHPAQNDSRSASGTKLEDSPHIPTLPGGTLHRRSRFLA